MGYTEWWSMKTEAMSWQPQAYNVLYTNNWTPYKATQTTLLAQVFHRSVC